MANQQSARVEVELDSDEDDDDYMPSEEESEEEVVSAVEDDIPDGGETPKKGKKRKGKMDHKARKRCGGIHLEDESKTDDEPSEDNDFKTEYPLDQESQKKRADSLWADFMSDVTPPIKQKATAKPTSAPTEKETKKVTVTKVYQFAGEEVKVVKEVDANSKELFLETSIPKTEPQKENHSEAPKTPALGVGPKKSGLSSVLGKIAGNKNKLSTLEKSKLDWETFKSEKRISEDLEQHNRGKDGYLEKQAFLERADLRQFENEKTLRIKSRSTKNW